VQVNESGNTHLNEELKRLEHWLDEKIKEFQVCFTRNSIITTSYLLKRTKCFYYIPTITLQ